MVELDNTTFEELKEVFHDSAEAAGEYAISLEVYEKHKEHLRALFFKVTGRALLDL